MEQGCPVFHETKRQPCVTGEAASPGGGAPGVGPGGLRGGPQDRLFPCVVRLQAEVAVGGLGGCRPRPLTGRPARLTARQMQKLLKLLLQGATAHGYTTGLWTLPCVAEVIAPRVRGRVSPCACLACRPGMRVDLPTTGTPRSGAGRASDRGLVEWSVAAHETGARRAGRRVVFLDETGLMVQPV